MRGVLKKAWLSLLFQGALNLVSGVLVFIMKSITILALTQLLGVFSLCSGLVLLAGAFYSRKDDEHWWFLLQSGILQVVLSILFFTALDETGLKLILLIGICAIVIGVSAIVASLRLREEMANENSLIIIGIISILFGSWMVFYPGDGLLDRRWHVAAYLSFSGVATLYLAYRVWKLGREMNTRIGSIKDEININDY
jgi:uncharacterized membrane protein HdeD (DUF308 family)